MTPRERALELLAARSVATLATVGAEGPWASAVFYASRDFTLYFLSSPRSRHALNLAASPRVAAAIHEDQPDWRLIKGIQLEGLAAEIEAAEALAVYAAKFPLVAAPPEPIAAALARVRWYRLAADRVYLVDNAAGFGSREEVPLPSAR